MRTQIEKFLLVQAPRPSNRLPHDSKNPQGAFHTDGIECGTPVGRGVETETQAQYLSQIVQTLLLTFSNIMVAPRKRSRAWSDSRHGKK